MKTGLFPKSSQLLACIFAVSIGLLTRCSPTKSADFLGSAILEARTFLAATTAQGSVLAVYKQEGEAVKKNELLAIVDTMPLILRREELLAGRSELIATLAAKKGELSALKIDISGLEREYKRIEKLVSSGSAPAQKRDNLKTQLESAKSKYEANTHILTSMEEKKKGIAARLNQLDDQIQKCYLRAPSGGVILTRYRSAGEIAGPATPIFEIGTYDTLYADFFVPQPVLATLNLETPVAIRLDYESAKNSNKEKFVQGYISWIGSEAEFSPKNIQTRESRNELVFRVRAMAPNTNGMLKRGLPVEIWRSESH